MGKLGSNPVIDLGSFSLKAGFAGEAYPVVEFTCEQFPWPIKRGEITDWNQLEELLTRVWTELRIVPDEEDVITFVEPAESNQTEREILKSLMFDKFKAKKVTFVPAPLTSLLSEGKSTGVVVDVGHGVTRVCPVINYIVQHQATFYLKVGGRDVTNEMCRLLHVSNPRLLFAKHIREIKEKLSFTSLKPEQELVNNSRCLQREHVLPSGGVVKMDRERGLCTEVLLNPQADRADRSCLSELIKRAINSCEAEARDELCQNIVLCGGASQAMNFNYRLLAELMKINTGRVVRVVCPVARHYAAWYGASNIMFFTPEFREMGTERELPEVELMEAESRVVCV